MAKDPKSYNPQVFAPAKNKPYAKKETAPISHGELMMWYDYADQVSKAKHWEFYVIDQFLKGNHNIRGNPADNTLILSPKNDEVNFPINRIYTGFRAVKAFVTRHKPVATIETSESTEEAKAYARRANRLIERDNLLNNGRRLNKEWVHYGVKYGIGWRQVGYDPDKKVCMRWSIDPWDLLIGASTGEAEDAPYIIKTMVRTVDYWRNKYPNSNIQPDDELAADEYKKLSIQVEMPNATAAKQRLEQRTALGYECWYRIFKPNKNGGLINKCLFTRTEILNVEETPYTEYPFIPYEADVEPNEIYPQGNLKHSIAPQRLLNLLNTQLLEYNHITNRGRILMDKNSGLRVIMAKEGQIIQRNPGKRVEVLNPPSLSPDLRWQLQYSDNVIEDIIGQHDASQGVTPQRVSSGAAIEALQQGDSNNISDLRDNFEDALAKEASWILKMYSLFEKDGVVLNQEMKDKNDTFAIVGAEALKRQGRQTPEKYFIEDNGTYCDVCAILPDNQVKVSIVSQLGETREARMDLLFKLVEAGLPLKVVLEHLEFPNTQDILERIAEEGVGDALMEQMKGQMGATAAAAGMGEGGQMPPTPPGVEDQAALAELNNQMGGMLNE